MPYRMSLSLLRAEVRTSSAENPTQCSKNTGGAELEVERAAHESDLLILAKRNPVWLVQDVRLPNGRDVREKPRAYSPLNSGMSEA